MELSRVCISIVHLEGCNTRASVQSAQSFYSATSCSIVWVPVAACSAAVLQSPRLTSLQTRGSSSVSLSEVDVSMSMSTVNVFRFSVSVPALSAMNVSAAIMSVE